MFGTTLAEIRDRVETLASTEGDYHLVCARTGEHPVPASDRRFPDREAARAAAHATEQYRAALRRYDPRVPYHDVIACEVPPRGDRGVHTTCPDEGDWSLSEPVLAGKPPEPDDRRRVSFCHDVAAATFEALSARGHAVVESAVMDAYFDLAERLSDPDDLCLRLLESVAAELEANLDARAEAVVLADAAERLGPIEGDGDPVVATLARFQELGLVRDYSCSSWSIDGDGTRSATIEVEEYALARHGDRLPVLPVVLDLYRRHFDRHCTRVRATETTAGWRIALELATVGRPDGISCAPILETT